jgi:hypothetical protein
MASDISLSYRYLSIGRVTQEVRLRGLWLYIPLRQLYTTHGNSSHLRELTMKI